MSTLWTDALETFLKHLTHDNSVGSSYFFVDVHVSAGTPNNLESASKSKLVQYNNAWNQFRHEILPSNPDKYRHFMTRYQQINHSRKGQPKVFVFGINYDGYLDSYARDFMYHLATIKYPTDPNNRSYQPSRARWISHYARQIQLAIANGAALAISYTFRNLKSHLSRSVLPPDLDQNIPAFHLSENGFLERHPDKYAYESINAAGKIVLQATPAYQFEPIVQNKNPNITHTNDRSVINIAVDPKSAQDEDRLQPITETLNTGQDNDDMVTRSREDEDRVFAAISNLFPSARENDMGIKSFYFLVQETLGMNLDDDLWVPFVWDTVCTMMNNYRQRTSLPPCTYVEHGNIPHCDIPLSQIWNSQVNIEYHEPSDRLRVVPQNQDDISSSIDIENIATANNHHTNTQAQLLSATQIQDSTGANRSVDFNTSVDITDDTSLTLVSTPDADINDINSKSSTIATRVRAKNENARKHIVHDRSQRFNALTIYNLTHTSTRDISDVDNNSETSESQSIDINSININNHVPSDCESLSIDIDEIATRGRESEGEMVGVRNKSRQHTNDNNDKAKGKKADGENDNISEIDRERERGNDKSGREKRRKKVRKSGNTTARKGRRNTVRGNESDKGNDSVLTDEKEDSIASRMKRRRNQQPDDDDDENNSYVY